MRATDSKVEAKRVRAPFDAATAAYRVACQLFPGFASLPTPVLVSLEPYAGLFDPVLGPLGLEDREAIATAVGEVVGGTALADATSTVAGSVRMRSLARFAVKLLARSCEVDGVDLERLIRAGFSRAEVGAAAETAIGYHVIARLTSAARGHRPAVCEQLTAPRGIAVRAA